MTDVIDLSVPVDRSTLGPPAAGSPPVAIETAFRGPGHWQSSRIAALLHTGSHVDAPLHVVARGDDVEAMGLTRLAGDAVVVDLTAVGDRAAIDGALVADAAADLREGDIVVLRTDWSDRMWGRFPDYYTRSPYLTHDAADWIAERRPRAVVFDFFEEECAVTPEFTSEDFVVHRSLLGRGIPLVEQATNIGAVGASRFTLWAPFVRLVGVEASPCRILAVRS